MVLRRDFFALKAEVDELGINKFINVLSSLNSLKTKVDDLDADKLKTVPVDLKKLSDVVSKEVVKKTVRKKLNSKVKRIKFLMHLL